MSRFSFIIPVFNCKNYLLECVESIEQIGLSDYEILLIDDGSTDGSGELCDCLATSIKSIRCHHQDNKGVSAARNVGFECSTGDYIVFADSDDTYDPKGMKEALRYLDGEPVDIAIFGIFIDFYHKGAVYRSDELRVPLRGLKRKQEWIEHLDQLYSANALNPIWNKVFSRSFLKANRLLLREDMFLYEDLEYSLRCMSCCDKILFIPDGMYHYRQAEDEGNAGRRLKRIPHIADLVNQVENAAEGLIQSCAVDNVDTQIGNILLSLYLVLAREKIAVSNMDEIGQICDEFRHWMENRNFAVSTEQKGFVDLLIKRKVRQIMMHRTYVSVRHRIAIRVKALMRKYKK